jgi:hypothetical protein
LSHKKPFHRNFRPTIDGSSCWAYIVNRSYSISPEHYTRAFLIIQKDLLALFEFVEPSDINLKTYSYRIHELLIRTCIEIEANFKAILSENIYTPKDKKGRVRLENKWNIIDYKKVNKTHHLDSYVVKVPIWNGEKAKFRPFSAWKNNENLSWYKAYNQCKHDRNNKFVLANLENLIYAVTGLLVLLTSQFKNVDFSPRETLASYKTASYYTGEVGIGDFFRIEYPTNWTEEEKYEFNWNELENEINKFEKINFNNI